MIIEKRGLKCHSNFWLLPEDFLAITLFGHIFFRLTDEEMETHLNSYGGDITINHERIHVIQAESFKTKYLGFYIVYLWYWFIGLFKYGVKNNISYHKIPFEIEAYKNQYDFDYSETHWKNYKS